MMAGPLCALCQLPPNCPSNGKKLKKLFGDSFLTERAILQSLLTRRNSFISFDSNAMVCIFCQRALSKIHRLEKELEHAVAAVYVKLEKLCQASSTLPHIAMCQASASSTSGHLQSPLVPQPSTSFSVATNTSLHEQSQGCSDSLNIEPTVEEQNNENDQVMETESTTPGHTRDSSDCVAHKRLTPKATVVVQYPSGVKHFDLTPNRKKTIISYTKRHYKAAAKRIVNSKATLQHVVTSLSQQIRKEMNEICSADHHSVLRDSYEAVKRFSWESIWLEYQAKVPTLLALLTGLLPKAEKKFITFVVSLLLKRRCKHMSLVQRVISLVLYGNAAKKQIYNCLQPFMVCMSARVTSRIVDKIVEDYNVEVLFWADELRDNLKFCHSRGPSYSLLHEVAEDSSSDEQFSDNESCRSDCSSISSPEFEPLECDEDDELIQVIESSVDVSNNTSSFEQSLEDERFMDATSSGIVTTYCECCGFVIVGDNLDKNFRPSHQREDRRTRSMHIFHSCAIKNRVDVSSLSDKPASAVLSVDAFLLNSEDIHKLQQDFEIMISRILVQNMEEFKGQLRRVIWHIESSFQKEMSAKSKVVPLGVQMKNEIYLTDMAHIMESFNQYVPSELSSQHMTVNGKEYEYDDSKLIQLLVFGDQLTVAKARSAAVLREPQRGKLDRLEGFVPCVADWHSRMCFLQIIWSRFFSANSYDKGTLSQLKHLIHRNAVGPDPKNNMKATEDFLLLILCAHVISASKQCMEAGNDCLSVANKVVTRFTKITISSQDQETHINDNAYNYATDLLTMLLVWHGFHDSVKEGDGDRILLYWKVMLPVFQQSGHYNYAKEAFLLLAQSHTLSDRKVTELKWSRTVNVHGRVGCNIPVDLHMEHLNRRLKSMIGNLGSNVHCSAIERIAKSLGVVDTVCRTFEAESEAPVNKGYCSYPSFTKDLNHILSILEEQEVYKVQEGRTLENYKSTPFFNSLKWKNINEWVKSKLINLRV